MSSLNKLLFMLLSACATHCVLAQSVADNSARSFTQYGIQAQVASIGFGGEVVTNFTDHLNLALSADGANFSFSDPSASGIDYRLNYRPREATLGAMLFPFDKPRFRPMYFSSGVVLTTHYPVLGKLYVPAGQAFKLNGTPYVSAVGDPIQSTVEFGSGRLAYTAGAGWGNILHGSHHISVPVEIGLITYGQPVARTYPAGSVCDPGLTLNCREVSTDPKVQANEQAEAERVAENHRALQYVPIVKVGVAYMFGR